MKSLLTIDVSSYEPIMSKSAEVCPTSVTCVTDRLIGVRAGRVVSSYRAGYDVRGQTTHPTIMTTLYRARSQN